jgi:hypothetical protein
MMRPDQERFERFSRHFEMIDSEVNSFAKEHGFEVIKNLNRQPGRILRKQGNPLQLIDVFLDGHWLQLEYQEDLPHSVGVAVYYQPPQGKRLVKKLMLVERQPFSLVRESLDSLLQTGLQLLDSWPVPALSEEKQDAANQGWTRTLV